MADAGKAVLIVDDDPDLRALLELVLDGAGYRVVTAEDGRAALRQVEQGMPAVILLDMKMPNMSGWEFAREFRARHDQRAPIVVLTAALDAQQRAEEIGAEGYLGKPFEIKDLIHTVERHIGGAA